LNENSLDYLVEIVDAKLFEEPIYPEIFDKAAIYLLIIISNHIFTDGNKRTGLDACLLFFAFNGYELSENVSNEMLTNFIISVASGEHTLETVQAWLKEHAVKR